MTRPSHTTIRLIGSKHWCRELAALMSEQPGVAAQAVSVQELALDLLRGRRGQLTVRVGFRPFVNGWRGVVFDAVWLLSVSRRSRRTYWIGTDVTQTVENDRSGPAWRRLRRALIGRAACGAPWFVSELAAIGVHADYVRFPHRTAQPSFSPWPTDFVVSIYVPAMKPAFYGADVLPTVADATPGVTYLVYGDGDVPARPNIRQIGRVPDLSTRLAEGVVHLRLTEHDAIAGTVREALAHGRYVLFGYELPGVITVDVRSADQIAAHVRALESAFRAGELTANTAGIDLVSQMSAADDAKALVRWVRGDSDPQPAPPRDVTG